MPSLLVAVFGAELLVAVPADDAPVVGVGGGLAGGVVGDDFVGFWAVGFPVGVPVDPVAADGAGLLVVGLGLVDGLGTHVAVDCCAGAAGGHLGGACFRACCYAKSCHLGTRLVVRGGVCKLFVSACRGVGGRSWWRR